MSASSTIVRAGVPKHHFRSSSRVAKCCLVAMQCSAARRSGRMELAVVQPAWKLGFASSSRYILFQSRRMRSVATDVATLRRTSTRYKGQWFESEASSPPLCICSKPGQCAICWAWRLCVEPDWSASAPIRASRPAGTHKSPGCCRCSPAPCLWQCCPSCVATQPTPSAWESRPQPQHLRVI